MWGGSLRGSNFLQLSPLGSIIAGAASVLRLRLGYSCLCCCPATSPNSGAQFPANEKFTVIRVSTSTGSPFKI